MRHAHTNATRAFAFPADEPLDERGRAAAAALRGAAPATWPSRVADYHTFASTELWDWVRDSGLQVIGYRPLRDLMRGG